MSETEIVTLMKDAGFTVTSTSHTPRGYAGDWMAWRQFRLFLQHGTLVSAKNFLLPYLLLSLRSLLDQSDYLGGVIVVASKPR